VVPCAQAPAVADAADKRLANEDDKRRRLASGELGLDMYGMREGLAKAGLRYVDSLADLGR
jgi:4-hydroxy-4-methyl-2-oxoglutarate aldolase